MHPALSVSNSPEKVSSARDTNRISNRSLLTGYDGVCHENSLDDGFLVVFVQSRRSSGDVPNEVTEPNRTA